MVSSFVVRVFVAIDRAVSPRRFAAGVNPRPAERDRENDDCDSADEFKVCHFVFSFLARLHARRWRLISRGDSTQSFHSSAKPSVQHSRSDSQAPNLPIQYKANRTTNSGTKRRQAAKRLQRWIAPTRDERRQRHSNRAPRESPLGMVASFRRGEEPAHERARLVHAVP